MRRAGEKTIEAQKLHHTHRYVRTHTQPHRHINKKKHTSGVAYSAILRGMRRFLAWPGRTDTMVPAGPN